MEVAQNDMIGIYNALAYACAFIDAGRASMDETAHSQLKSALAQARKYTDGDPEATHESVAVACVPAFSVDDVPIRVGNAVRVVYEDRESETILTVILTHEGIIMDVWDAYANEPTATSSITYDEQLISMLGS